MNSKLSDLKIILGSGSPRRKQILAEAGYHFEVRLKEIDETPKEGLVKNEIAENLALMKSLALKDSIKNDEILITADTIVCFNELVLNKPNDHDHAFEMISLLNGNTHQVYTGVCVFQQGITNVFSIKTDVEFNLLSNEMIEQYITDFKPFDKAGSYGAQECLPENFNPCSREEIDFMQSINKPNLFKNTIVPDLKKHIPLIKNINGSYFNVMGLPIRELTLFLLND